MTTIEFPHNREKYIGYVELALGLGLMLGPVMGSLFMSLTNNDFEVTFYIFGALIAAGGMFAFIALPNYLNKAELGVETTGLSARASIVSIGIHGVERPVGEDSDEEEDSLRGPNGKKQKQKKVTFGMFLKHPRSLFCLLACGVSMICLLFFESTLAKYLKNHFGIDASWNGIIFAIPCLFYAGSSPFVSMLTKIMQRRLIIFFAFILNIIALLLMGPSEMLGFPERQYNQWLTYVGLALNGVSISFIFVPLLPEILYVVGTAEGLSDDNNELNDKASGIYNVAYASGTILAPNIGGILAEHFGFRVMCDCLAVFSMVFSIIFLFANVGVKTFCDIKPDPRLHGKKKKGSVHKEETDPNSLLKRTETDDSKVGLLDSTKPGQINKSELTPSNLENYANASP